MNIMILEFILTNLITTMVFLFFLLAIVVSVYYTLYTRYRNKDKRHEFEKSTQINMKINYELDHKVESFEDVPDGKVIKENNNLPYIRL